MAGRARHAAILQRAAIAVRAARGALAPLAARIARRFAASSPSLAILAGALVATTALLTIGGAIYLAWAGLDARDARPMTLVRYGFAYGARPGEAVRLILSGIAAPAALAVGALVALDGRRHVHGRARWGGLADMARARLFADRGLILGRAFATFVRDGGEGHVCVVAPTGAGKTSGVVIPNLLSWTGSVVALDPKREAWATTAGWRAAHGAVFLWAPLDAQGRSCRFNPLDQFMDRGAGARAPSPRRAVELMKLAAALIPEPANDTRWIAQGAQRLFRALALYVLDTQDAPATIGEIWRIVSTPDDLQAWCHLQAVSRRDLDPACLADLAAFAGAVDKERAYILNEVQNALQPWSSALVRAATDSSDFRLADLHRRRMAIYLALDPGDMAAYGKLLRMFVELAADALMRADMQARRRHEVLLLIDEFATFGRLPLIETLMAAVRGYGARVMIICQALSQLDDIYGLAGRNALLGNATRQLMMASPDPATNLYVSRRIGDTTIETRARSVTTGRAGRTSLSTGLAARALLKPEEFERLGRSRALLLSPGAPPFRVTVEGWFRNATLRKRRLPAPDVAVLDTEAPVHPFRATGARTRTRAVRPQDIRPRGIRPRGVRPHGVRPEGDRPGSVHPEGAHMQGDLFDVVASAPRPPPAGGDGAPHAHRPPGDGDAPADAAALNADVDALDAATDTPGAPDGA